MELEKTCCMSFHLAYILSTIIYDFIPNWTWEIVDKIKLQQTKKISKNVSIKKQRKEKRKWKEK